ncbi:ABC-2 type transport system ATP-binding protein [Paenibacillus cellulosilyticus]|uniref:ABC-2 type transport system ATP-binding protein n=1 Tax=Paenibacillus cellulosilyticus TaxID=375489 RepID=A0A2V2YPA0_9BACL|nr:ABC transporter ATP-binding protein [Paenibacillus cellulosilyticus]PWV94537.1 ABC-2 type transport system ATP-binding protein [Paenibacillus cellulosilyticus]QKS45041.1 ABC transporter ATP-binding protein [Paenibacillus cellulosilyticus]
MSILECNKLAKTFGDVQSLKDVSFAIEGKGCIGFLGANGAGKTTTIRIITGLAKPTSGTVKVVGYDVMKDALHIRKEIGYCPQAPAFYNDMTAEQWMHWVGKIFKLGKKEIAARTEELLKLCGIWEARHRAIGGFSGGMKQRLGIAQALINRPKLLVLDEPVSALDPMGRYDVLKLIEKLKSDMTIFMSTHILDDVERVADHIVIIDKGSVLLSQPMDELKSSYKESMIHLTIEPTTVDLVSILQTEPVFKKIHHEGNSFTIECGDIGAANEKLPQLLVSHGIRFTNYRVAEANLEQIFMKVVQS